MHSPGIGGVRDARGRLPVCAAGGDDGDDGDGDEPSRGSEIPAKVPKLVQLPEEVVRL